MTSLIGKRLSWGFGVSLAAATSLLASGCGGGQTGTSVGGGSDASGGASSRTLAAASKSVHSRGVAYTASGSGSDGNHYRLNLSVLPVGEAAFEGATHASAVTTVSLFRNGIFVSTESRTTYYDKSTGLPVGSTGWDPVVGAYSVVAKSGESGASTLSTQANHFDNSGKSRVVGTSSTDWQLKEAATDDRSWACANTALTPAGSTSAIRSGSDCFEIDQSGNITGRFKGELRINESTELVVEFLGSGRYTGSAG